MPGKRIYLTEDDYQRFWGRVKPSSGCWEWVGGKTPDGYGGFRWKKKGNSKPHRASYQMFFGEIPEKNQVCHKCDNPTCVNPDHLFVGTSKENAQDMVMKGRQNKGTQRYNSKLTPANVRAIRSWGRAFKQRDVARIFGVHQSVVWNVLHKNRWKSVE